jgi:uncharacterized protein YjiS (DUF1127 family)
MSMHPHQMMTNHHVPGIWTQLGETLHIWRQRYQSRQELARWTDRDLHDFGHRQRRQPSAGRCLGRGAPASFLEPLLSHAMEFDMSRLRFDDLRQ